MAEKYCIKSDVTKSFLVIKLEEISFYSELQPVQRLSLDMHMLSAYNDVPHLRPSTKAHMCTLGIENCWMHFPIHQHTGASTDAET